MISKLKIKKGDYVQVISGDDKGKRGKVLRVFPKKNKIIVEGVNFIYRHVRRTQQNIQSGRVEKEAPLNISNVMVYCPHCQSLNRPCFKFEKDEKEGNTEKIRCCRKCKGAL